MGGSNKVDLYAIFPVRLWRQTTFSPAGVASIAQCYVGWYMRCSRRAGGAERAYAHEVWDIQKNKYIHQDVLQTTLGSGSLVVAIPIRCLAILP